MKICNWCKQTLSDKAFHRLKNGKLRGHCRACHKAYCRERRELIASDRWEPQKKFSNSSRQTRRRARAVYDMDMFLQLTYNSIASRCNGHSKKLYENLERCSRKEFYLWAKTRGDFYNLFHQWNRKYFARKYRPTIDRIDPARGYVYGNMRWLTLSQNSQLGGTK